MRLTWLTRFQRTCFEHDDDLLTLLSSNEHAVSIYKRDKKKAPPLFLRQSFQSAAKVFTVIDTTTQGVIVPYRKEGKRIINDLCSAFEPGKQFDLIKDAQRYAVNIFPHKLQLLWENRAIFEVQEGSGIFYLQQEFYSEDFGITDNVVNEMKFLSI